MKSLKKCVFPLLGVIVVSAFPALFLYCQNADEAGFLEIAKVMLIFVSAGLVLWVLFWAVARLSEKGALAAIILILILTNFAYFEKGIRLVLPQLRYWHTLPIIIAVAMHLIWLIWRKVKPEILEDIVAVVCIVFAGLSVFNLVTSAPQIITHMKAEKSHSDMRTQMEYTDVGQDTSPRNIYLFVFDEYANFPQMEKYYGYDNAVLREFFEKYHFSYSLTSQNESFVSSTVQTNMVNLEYIVQKNTPSESEKESLRKNGVLFQVLREYGYRTNILETMDFYGGHMPDNESNKGGAVTINGKSLSDLLFQRSVLYPLYNEKDDEDLKLILDLSDYLSSPDNLPEGNTFTLVYFNFPHQPFMVDENGHYNPPEGYVNWQDDKYYLGQFKYCTGLMIKMLDNIVTNDPDAVLMVCSDHGARALNSGKFAMEYMINSLNAVYMGGREDYDIEGLSNVNTLRSILNEVFGTKYEMLDVPDYTV